MNISLALSLAILELRIFFTDADQLCFESLQRKLIDQLALRIVGDEIFFQFEHLTDDDLDTLAINQLLRGTETQKEAKSELARRKKLGR